jgi:endonuclease/exonuclease/phosphatase family metal-dependent hydrolase
LTENGAALYTVIRAEESSTNEFEAAKEIFTFIGEQGQVTASLSTDWIRRNSDPDAVSNFEILVGDTNRTASSAVLGEITGDTWCVEIVDGRIVIQASAGYLLADAVAHFKSMCTVVDGILMLDTSLCKREVLENELITADITLRVGSYNIKNGAQVNHDMSKIAEDILALNLDVVGLQEVDICTKRAKGLDVLKLLAEATGYQYYEFTKAIDFQGGGYGTAILSRYPIIHHEAVLLVTPGGYEQRAYGHAVIEVNGAKLHFFNTHLSYENTEIRTAQFAQLAEATANCRGYVLTADFNTADLDEFKVFDDATLANPGKYPTFPSSSSAIDNIVLDEGWEITDSGMLASNKSDHNLLWAEIHYKG